MHGPERWLSGRKRRTRNPVYGSPYRGFESHPFRQNQKKATDSRFFYLARAAIRLFLTYVFNSRNRRSFATARRRARAVLVRAGLNRAACAGIDRHVLGARASATGEDAVGADRNARAFRSGANGIAAAAAAQAGTASTYRTGFGVASGIGQARNHADTFRATHSARRTGKSSAACVCNRGAQPGAFERATPGAGSSQGGASGTRRNPDRGRCQVWQ